MKREGGDISDLLLFPAPTSEELFPAPTSEESLRDTSEVMPASSEVTPILSSVKGEMRGGGEVFGLMKVTPSTFPELRQLRQVVSSVEVKAMS